MHNKVKGDANARLSGSVTHWLHWGMRLSNTININVQIRASEKLQSRRTLEKNLYEMTQIYGCHLFFFLFSLQSLCCSTLMMVEQNYFFLIYTKETDSTGPIRHLPYSIYVIFHCRATGWHLQWCISSCWVSAFTDQECTRKVVDFLVYNFYFVQSLTCCPTRH